MIAHGLRGRGLSAGVEEAIIISGTAATCIATYEIVRRVGWLRPLFGLKSDVSEPAISMQASGEAAN
jgi:hypothetical protein